MLRPPPQLTVSEWAERHRMLGSRASAEPGPWRTSRTPYLKDVMDALSAVHPARRVVFMKGAQVGATESGNNWLGYIMHHVPAPALAVQPTVELAKRFSRQCIDSLLEETPALRERVAPPKRPRLASEHGSILSGNFTPNRVSSQWHSTLGEDPLVHRAVQPGGFAFLERVQLVQATDEEQIGDLLDDLERVPACARRWCGPGWGAASPRRQAGRKVIGLAPSHSTERPVTARRSSPSRMVSTWLPASCPAFEAKQVGP